uniref:dUTP diphosphatase n=1 Tax=Aegilops tauschii subsp. strangulata TaxID=200361 RepID=A0A452XPK9_AEGTS
MKKISYSQECELTCFHFPDVGAEVIDADYRDPVGVVLFNNSEADFAVKPGDRLTQMIVQVIAMLEVAEVEDLDVTVWRTRRHRIEVAEVEYLDATVSRLPR